MQTVDIEVTQPLDVEERASPREILKSGLEQLAQLELDFSNNVVKRYGQRAYEIVRVSREVSSTAVRCAESLKEANIGRQRQPR